MNRLLSKRAQSLIEYSLILAILGAALVGMQVYMKRGIQGVVKTAADQLGTQEGAQVLINFKRQTNSVTATTGSRAGAVATHISAGGTQTRDTSITSTSSGSSVSVSEQ